MPQINYLNSKLKISDIDPKIISGTPYINNEAVRTLKVGRHPIGSTKDAWKVLKFISA